MAEKAEEQPQGGRLAGTVRAKQADDFAGMNLERHRIEGAKRAIILGKMVGDEEGCCHPFARRKWSASPAAYSGNNTCGLSPPSQL